MTTREHLALLLQDLYAFQRDYLPMIDALHHLGRHEGLRAWLQRAREGMRTDQETLERALDLMSARFTQGHNAIAQGLHDASERFRRHRNPSQEQLDIHAALEGVKVLQLLIGTYFGGIEMARAIGEQDVATLLEENTRRAQDALVALETLIPIIILDVSQREARRAA